MILHRTKEIPLSWNITVRSWIPKLLLIHFQSYNHYFWGENGIVSFPVFCWVLQEASCIIWHSKLNIVLNIYKYLSLWAVIQIFWGENKNQSAAMGVLQKPKFSHMHALELVILLQEDELVQALTIVFLFGVGCHFFSAPPDATLLLQNSISPPAQWKQTFFLMLLCCHESLLSCFLQNACKPFKHRASCLFLSMYCNSLR